MKLSQLTFLVLLAFSITITGCLKDECAGTTTFIQWNPVYKSLEEIRAEIQIEGARTLEAPGKLYFYGDYVLINERNEGIHIIDNSDSANPQNISFLAIPGNVDMAVKDGFLYADNYIDLLTIDIKDPTAPQVVKRTEEVFSPQGIHPELGLIVDYVETETTLEIDCFDPRFGQNRFVLEDVVFTADIGAPAPVANQAGGSTATDSGTGIGGSFARFTIVEDYLYTVDQFNLRVFDIAQENCPEFRNEVQVGWGIETIFPLKDKLFIGSNNGLFIYDVANPVRPRQLSVFEHARACDPVFVKGDIAFVTLRDGTFCEGFNNQLDVINVANLEAPRLLHTYPMENPHGLSIRGDELYLCEGEFGFKTFDISDLSTIDENLLNHKKDFQAYDVIAIPNKQVVMIVGDDGFYQFDTSDPTNLKELSLIPVK